MLATRNSCDLYLKDRPCLIGVSAIYGEIYDAEMGCLNFCFLQGQQLLTFCFIDQDGSSNNTLVSSMADLTSDQQC